ncbi:MAG TPA: hypothetical protein VE685_11530 [Thermoanaerobaculia bacterium]|nr:hypothetical protein [Thermoanaerobaculia bacterium]
MKILRRTPLAALLALLLLAAAPVPPGPFEFERLNRSYSDVAPEIVPVTEGLVDIRLSSPSNQLTVVDHLLRLEPGPGGVHTAELRVEFEGRGLLVADIDVAGFGTRMQDQVVVPRQIANLEGRAAVQRVPEGYRIILEELPPRLAVHVESEMAGRIVGTCERAAQFSQVDVDCSGLDRKLSNIVFPTPRAGEVYLLEETDLTPAERERLDAYLGSADPR